MCSPSSAIHLMEEPVLRKKGRLRGVRGEERIREERERQGRVSQRISKRQAHTHADTHVPIFAEYPPPLV